MQLLGYSGQLLRSCYAVDWCTGWLLGSCVVAKVSWAVARELLCSC